MKFLFLLALLIASAWSQVCVYRIAVSIPNANGTVITVYDDTSNQALYELMNLDVTPYYNVPCGNLQYSFYNGKNLLTTTKNTPASGTITTLVLFGLISGSGNASLTTQAFVDNWNVTEGTALVRIINAAPNSGVFSIEANHTTFQPNVNFQQATKYAVFPSNGQYAFYFTNVASNQIVLDEFLFLNDQTSYTFWIQGQSGNLEVTMTQDYPPDVPSSK